MLPEILVGTVVGRSGICTPVYGVNTGIGVT